MYLFCASTFTPHYYEYSTPVSSVETHSNVEGVASTTPDLVEELPKLGVQLISNKISIPGHKTASHCDNDIDPSSYEVTLMQHEGIINPGYITDKAMTFVSNIYLFVVY